MGPEEQDLKNKVNKIKKKKRKRKISVHRVKALICLMLVSVTCVYVCVREEGAFKREGREVGWGDRREIKCFS